MEQAGIALIAGLGNPGNRYAATRHNVGFWLLERLQRTYPITFATEKKFKAQTGRFECNGRHVRIIAPDIFMNLSGQSIAPMASFYRIAPAQILVIHDELDLPPGSARLKIGGGHGGHNGLRDLVSKLGASDFLRMRIGIGHPGINLPGVNQDVSGYVLNKPPSSEQTLIEDAIDKAIGVLPDVVCGNYQKAMNQLHSEAKKDNLGKDKIGTDKIEKAKVKKDELDEGDNIERR